MNVTTIGIDIAKEVFQLYGINTRGKGILEKRIKPVKLMEFMSKLNLCRIVSY